MIITFLHILRQKFCKHSQMVTLVTHVYIKVFLIKKTTTRKKTTMQGQDSNSFKSNKWSAIIWMCGLRYHQHKFKHEWFWNYHNALFHFQVHLHLQQSLNSDSKTYTWDCFTLRSWLHNNYTWHFHVVAFNRHYDQIFLVRDSTCANGTFCAMVKNWCIYSCEENE